MGREFFIRPAPHRPVRMDAGAHGPRARASGHRARHLHRNEQCRPRGHKRSSPPPRIDHGRASIDKCLADMVAAKALSQEQADDALAMVAPLRAANLRSMGPRPKRWRCVVAHRRRDATRAGQGRAAGGLSGDRHRPRAREAGSHPRAGLPAWPASSPRRVGRVRPFNVEARDQGRARHPAFDVRRGLDAYRTRWPDCRATQLGLRTLRARALWREHHDATGAQCRAAWNETADYAWAGSTRTGGDLRNKQDGACPSIGRRQGEGAGAAQFKDDMMQAFPRAG